MMLQLRKITIRNYRSIEEVVIEILPHQKSNLFCLVGQNNSGKSNILDAIKILFDPRPPYLEKEDFFNQDPGRTISFEAMFWEPVRYKPFQSWDYEIQICGMRRERKVGKRGETKGQLIWVHSSLDLSGKTLQKPREIPKKGSQLKFDMMFEIPKEIWDRLHVIYIPVNRDLGQHLPNQRRGFLHRTLERIDESFNKLPVAQEFEKHLASAMDLLRIPEFKSLEGFLKMVLDLFFEKELDVTMGNPSSLDCFRVMAMSFLENDITISLDRTGEGARFVLFLGIVFAYYRLVRQECIFIIEEPELHLHPQRQRVLREFILNDLANINYVFLSTHSPEFLDLSDYKTIYRVGKDASTSLSRIEGDFEEALTKHIRRCLDQSMKYAFFASAVILVEGESDHKVFPIYADRLGKPLDSRNITVVYAGGKKSLQTLAKMLRSLRIPVVLCYDKDSNKDEGANITLQNLFPGDSQYAWIELDPNLEGDICSSMNIPLDDWETFRGKGKIEKIVNIAADETTPIPAKCKQAIETAYRFVECKGK